MEELNATAGQGQRPCSSGGSTFCSHTGQRGEWVLVLEVWSTQGSCLGWGSLAQGSWSPLPRQELQP